MPRPFLCLPVDCHLVLFASSTEELSGVKTKKPPNTHQKTTPKLVRLCQEPVKTVREGGVVGEGCGCFLLFALLEQILSVIPRKFK